MKTFRYIFRLLKWAIDICMAALTLLASLFFFVKARWHTPRKGTRLFCISSGSGIETIHRKYGTLNVYLEDNPGCFDHVTRLLPGYTNCRIQLRDNFTVIEQNTAGTRFPLTGFARLIYRIAQAGSGAKVDIVHVRDPYATGIVGVIASRLLDAPLLISIHSDYEKNEQLCPNSAPRIFGSLRIAQYVERFCIRQAARILIIRESMIDHLSAINCDTSKVRLFPHGIPLESFKASSSMNVRETFDLPADAQIISSICRLEDENYADDILNIAQQLYEQDENIYVLLCGSGGRLADMRETIQAAGMQKRIIMPGEIARTLAYEIRKQSDVNLCLRGGFSLIEACAAGRPTIAYDIDWHYELIESGKTGLLAEEGNIQEIIEAISAYLDDPALRKRIGAAAQHRAFLRHDISQVNTTKNSIYMELIESNE